jgi:polyhydroxyalkanoate synthesis regulator phasin
MRKTILLAIGIFSLSYASLSYAEDNSNGTILEYYNPVQIEKLDKKIDYIESTFNAKIENLSEQVKAIQNKQNDHENAIKYVASQSKKEIDELKTQVETLTEELAKLKGEKSSVSVKETEPINFCITKKSVSIIDSEGRVITKLKKNIKLAVLDESDEYYKVKYKGNIGYVSNKYCRLSRHVAPYVQ